MSVDCYGWVEVNDPRKQCQARSSFRSGVQWCASMILLIETMTLRVLFNVYHHSDSAIAKPPRLPFHISESVEAETEDPTSILTAVLHGSRGVRSRQQLAGELHRLTPGWSLLLFNEWWNTLQHITELNGCA